ncbi:hypothetical protein Zm00014a_032347 [Zea mays]|uniref:Uncharacterized protein n=1 Tax=Zea mays TaxID=4577 RepID=A0A3L6FJ70_MAIZE|nr:hypothetical protein Zm00014a_032347 [Zea mays]
MSSNDVKKVVDGAVRDSKVINWDNMAKLLVSGGINGERSEIVEIEAASTGEAALRAALEEMKGELAHLKGEHAYTDCFDKSRAAMLPFRTTT